MRSLVLLCLLVLGCDRGGPTAGTRQRLVTLTPSSTEIVAALSATSDLVGVDDYSTYPPEVTKLPKVGSFLAPNLETIVGLHPTLVIVDDVHGKTAAALDDAHVATVECPIHAIPDVKQALRTVGGRIGHAADAERVVADIDRAIETARAVRPAKRPRVLAVIDREAGGLGNLVAAGTGSWLDELLAVVGGENVLAAAPVRYPKISTEEVVRTKPDLILDLSYAGRSDVTAWKAVTSARVVPLGQPYLVAPSPRITEAITDLAAALR